MLKRYLAVAGIAGFQRWEHHGGLHDAAGLAGGVHVAAYAALKRYLHVGGYFTYQGGDSVIVDSTAGTAHARLMHYPDDSYGVGATAKLGAWLLEAVWLGPALDIGADFNTVATSEGPVSRRGFQLFPRAQFEVPAHAGNTKLSVWTALGPMLVQYLASSGSMGWMMELEFLVGLSVGG